MITHDLALHPVLDAIIQANDNTLYLIREKNNYHERLILTPAVGIVLSQFNGNYNLDEIIQRLSYIFKSNTSDMQIRVSHIIDVFQDFISFHSDSVLPHKNHTINREILSCCTIDTKQDNRSNRPQFPSEIALIITRLCDKSCRYCYLGGSHGNSETITLSEWERVIDESVHFNCFKVFISGGEPLLVHNINQYISVASKKSCEVGLSTKYVINRDRMQALAESGLSYLQISLDSADSNMNDFLTGKQGSFQEICSTLSVAKRCGIRVTCRTVLTRHNMYTVPQLIDFAVKEKFSKITFNYYSISCENHNKTLLPLSEQTEWLDDWMTSNSKNYDIEINYTFGFSRWLNASSHYHCLFMPSCEAMQKALVIRNDGKVMFCNLLVNDDRFIVGDIKKDNIQTIWNSSETASLLNPSKLNYANTDCYNCKVFNSCTGRRCYMRTLLSKNRIFDKDPRCTISLHSE